MATRGSSTIHSPVSGKPQQQPSNQSNKDKGGPNPASGQSTNIKVFFEVCKDPSGNPPEMIRIECELGSAQVSPLIDKLIHEKAGISLKRESGKPRVFPDSVTSATEGGVSNTTDQNISCDFTNGEVVIKLPNKACNKTSMEQIVKWCNYHIKDDEFEKETYFEDFDEDEYERELECISELPCYFDWNFITTVGGNQEGELKEEKRVEFYNLMIAANILELDHLVLLGGKYICRQISNKSVESVRQLLGITNDLNTEADIIKSKNDAILGIKNK